MNDGNRSGYEIIPIGLLVVVIVIYQHLEIILHLLKLLATYVFWGLVIFGALYFLGLALRDCYYSLKQKYTDWKKWLADVDKAIESYKKKLDDHSGRISHLNHYQCAQDKELKALRAELAKINEKITPKEEATKSEANAKIAEAVEEIVRHPT